LVNWSLVCRPKNLGGLGIHDLNRFGRAYRQCWFWYQCKTMPNRGKVCPFLAMMKIELFFRLPLKSRSGMARKLCSGMING
jgi:hypothetical protein